MKVVDVVHELLLLRALKYNVNKTGGDVFFCFCFFEGSRGSGISANNSTLTAVNVRSDS